MKKITILMNLFAVAIGFAQPTTNAPVPTRLQANVISVYSDTYTTVATDLNPNWGQSGFGTVNTAFNPTGMGANTCLAYTNFNYQGTLLTTQNASAMEFLHIDVWSNANPATTILQVSPINNGTGAGEVLVTINHVQGSWYSVDIPKASFAGMTWDSVFQMKFAANGAGSTVPADFYIDNVYFWKAPASTAPTTNAPVPTRLQANVISVYSNSYTNVGTNYNPNWGQSGFGSVNAAYLPTGSGTNTCLAYTNFNYQGTELTTQNAAAMEYLHVDVWSNSNPATTILQVSPINNGTGPGEVLVTINHVQGSWYSVDIPKSAFTGMTWDSVFQLKFAANGAGSTTPADFYIDNVYFWKVPASTTQPTTNAPVPTRLQANVISVYSNSYTNVATNYNPNWGQSGFGTTSSTFLPTTTGTNTCLAYTNFNYQGTELTTQNASAMEFLHVDVWSNAAPASTILQVSPINNGTGAGEVLVTINHVQGSWYSVDIPKASFTGMNWDSVFQLKFAANGAGSTVPADFYIDNVYFWRAPSTATMPSTNAPVPTKLQSDVISIYSDTYTSVATNLNPNWGQSGFGTVNPTFLPTGAGTNYAMAYTNFNYQGTEITTQNASGMEFLHVDVWTNAAPGTSTIQVSPINNGTGAGEVLTTIAHTQGAWTSVDIPKSAFTGQTWDSVFQLKFAANGAGSATPINIYVDNVYFWRNPAPATAAPTPPYRAPANVISLFSDVYTNITVDNWNQAPIWYAPTGKPVLDVLVAGNATKKIQFAGDGFIGVVLNARNDATAMTHFHMDYWVPNGTDLIGKVLNPKWSNHPAPGGENNALLLTNLPTTAGSWVSLDVALSTFTAQGPVPSLNREALKEFLITSNLGDVFIDNIYLHNNNLSTQSFSALNIKMYPNPASNVLNIEALSVIENVSIHNMLGQEVISKANNNERVSIDVSSLQSGIYIIKTNIDGVTASSRFVKE